VKLRIVVITFILAAVFPIWFELGGVPVGSRSDGRYAAVSRDMSQRASWLVPYDENGPHLTKPPLTYWTEALCIRWLGPTALAVRIPSAIAGTLVLIGTLLVGWKIAGRKVGIIAAGLLAIMPLHVVISRLTLTDGLLAAGWFGALAGAYFCVLEPRRRRWPLLLWISVAAAWMIKGPVALIPLAGVLLWLIVGQRARDIRRLRPIFGLLLSMIPVLIWALLVWVNVPEAKATWSHEILGRLAGGGNHPKGPWFFIGILLAGMFPATCAMELPWLHQRWRDVWARFRHGDDVIFWVWAIIAPLVIFSLPAGKLVSYILPLCPPMALLVALNLNSWIDGRHDQPPAGYNPPDPHVILPVIMTGCAIAMVVVADVILGAGYVGIVIPFFIVPAACFKFMIDWRIRARRASALGLVWVSIMLSVIWGEALATHLISPWGTPAMLEHLQATTGKDDVVLTNFSDHDDSLSFYTGRFVQRSNNLQDLENQVTAHGSSLIVMAHRSSWRKLLAQHPKASDHFRQVMTWRDWPAHDDLLFFEPVVSDVLPSDLTPVPTTAPGQDQPTDHSQKGKSVDGRIM
jgi:4-amino-4-deoxy-L-arabinose transferase-like glycosyltransferase